MNIDDFAGASTQTVLQTPASVSADGNTAGIDGIALKGKAMVTLNALNTAGSTPTLAVKLQHAQDTDRITSVTPGSNTGNGTCTQAYGGPDSVAENITITIGADTGTFTVSGSVTGAMSAGVVGTVYSNQQVTFLVTAGTVGFAQNDTFVIVTTATTYADVPSGAFTGLTTGASQQKMSVNVDQLGRYLRVNYDIGGTSSPAYTVAIAAYSVNV